MWCQKFFVNPSQNYSSVVQVVYDAVCLLLLGCLIVLMLSVKEQICKKHEDGRQACNAFFFEGGGVVTFFV